MNDILLFSVFNGQESNISDKVQIKISNNLSHNSACGMWGIRVGVQIFKREFHTYIPLDSVKIEFLFYM